jgi:hypothetical protein
MVKVGENREEARMNKGKLESRKIPRNTAIGMLHGRKPCCVLTHDRTTARFFRP